MNNDWKQNIVDPPAWMPKLIEMLEEAERTKSILRLDYFDWQFTPWRLREIWCDPTMPYNKAPFNGRCNWSLHPFQYDLERDEKEISDLENRLPRLREALAKKRADFQEHGWVVETATACGSVTGV